jgi:hypothetical protein
MWNVTVTEAQMTALETAGIFECAESEAEVAIAAALNGNKLRFADPAQMAGYVCEISNHADDLAERDFRDCPERRSMYAKDARVLCNLQVKVARAACLA